MKKIFNKIINKYQSQTLEIPPEKNEKMPSCEDLNAWGDGLRTIGKELSDLAIATEPQFLELGNRLQDFSSAAGEISGLSIDAAQSLTGSEVEDAIYDLEEMLNRISLYLGHSDKELESNLTTLHSVIEIASEVEQTLEGFGKIIRMMRMLGVTTKIENAQFTNMQTNFSNLSNQVLQLSEEISDKSKIIRNGIKNLKNFSSSHLSRIMAQNERRSEQAVLIVENMQGCLSALKEKYDLSSETANLVSHESQAIADQINNIVMSMQFHDICRQRIEHVHQVLFEAIDNLSNDNRPQLGRTIESCELQVHQLDETQTTMQNAVAQLITSLTEIFHHTEGIGEMIHQMVHRSDSGQQSSFEQMETGIGDVEKLLKSNLHISAEIDEAIGSIVNMVQDVEGFVSDINSIGSDIELIAVNGIINAAHMGEQGASLSVLADAIQKLSVDARNHIQEVSAVLQEIGNSTQYLRFNMNVDDRNSGIGHIVDDMIRDLEGFVQTLRNVGEIVNEKMSKVERYSQSFVNAVKDNILKINVHLDFESVVTGSLNHIQSILQEMEYYHNEVLNGSSSESYESVVRNYTMNDEWQVHASFLKAKGVEVESPNGLAKESVPVSDENWGESIELF